MIGNSNPTNNSSLFGSQPNNTNNNGTSLFGGQNNGSLFGTAAQPSNNAQSISLFSNTAPTTTASNPPAQGNTTSLFGAKPATTGMGNSLFGNNNNTSTPVQPAASMFGNATNPATNAMTAAQPATSLFGPANTANTNGTSLFGVTQPTKPAETAKPTTINPPAATTATTAPATTSLFGNKSSTEPTPAANITTPANTNSNTNTASLFGNTTSPATTNPAPATLFGAKPANTQANPKPAETTPTTILFGNNPTTTTTPTNPQPVLFNQNTATQNSNPLGAQNNPVGAPQTAAFTNPVNPVPPKDDLQTQFQKSNLTVFQAIEEFKTTLASSYSDLKRLADNALKFLQERQENQTIVDNFTEVEKMIGGSSNVVQTLTSLEKQQEELAFQIEVMSRKIGEGQYTHELSDHLIEYGQLKNLVLQLQQDEGEWNDPGQQQIINMFQSLNQVQLQLKEMNELADTYLRDN